VGVSGPDGQRLYLDGVERCAGPDSGNLDHIWDPLIVKFDGHVDDVRIYTRPLNATEVARLAAGGQ
jgi:hypothetical protein